MHFECRIEDDKRTRKSLVYGPSLSRTPSTRDAGIPKLSEVTFFVTRSEDGSRGGFEKGAFSRAVRIDVKELLAGSNKRKSRGFLLCLFWLVPSPRQLPESKLQDYCSGLAE